MNVRKVVYNTRCECCGKYLLEEWADSREEMKEAFIKGAWRSLGDKDYCHGCWKKDGEEIVTADGRHFSIDGKETGDGRYHLDYLKDLLDDRLTLTQLRMEILKAQQLYRCMVGTLYKMPLRDEIFNASVMLRDRYEAAPEWQRQCYDSFWKIFYNIKCEGFPEKKMEIY